MHDELDANYFAFKALIVKNENRIYLENPNDWNIPSHILDETITYYKKINQTIKENIEKYPTQVALMISGYDCWLEQLEENWQIEDIKKCKLKFLNNYNEIIKLVTNTSKSVSKTNKSVSKEKVSSSKVKKDKTSKEKFKITVFFNYDKFNLSNNELIKLNEVITAANKFKDQSITIIGHTDTKGSDNYNLILSNKRANFIKKHLQSKNIINNIITKGLGEKSPLVDTGDNKLEEKNRRAQIIFN
jgi:outer membrane protein OmpA-like peptidoglycan-associated protein